MHHLKINCLPLPVSLSSLGGLYCTILSSFPQVLVNQWIESQLPLDLSHNQPTADRPPPKIPVILIDHGLQLHLWTCVFTPSKCISELHNLRLQEHLQTWSITASKRISELLDLGLPVLFQTRLITASKCISGFNLISVSMWIVKRALLRPRSVSLCFMISASKFISKLAQSRPPSASWNLLN